ncbi:MAG: type II toxin-antitoxin system RelE/ParE family toxin [Alphaproteobacteria bacterium]
MILRFRHKGLERLFATGDARGISAQHAEWIRVLLTTLSTSKNPADMNLPGFRLHPLKGKRKGQWAVSVSGNWRLLFEFDGENATNVDLVDYH